MYQRSDLIKLIDNELLEIYRKVKSSQVKLYVMKSGKYSIKKSGSDIFVSNSKRDALIEYIVVVQSRKETKTEDIFESIFGGGFGNPFNTKFK